MARGPDAGGREASLDPADWEGQEFLRFAACTTTEQVWRFCHAFGPSGLDEVLGLMYHDLERLPLDVMSDRGLYDEPTLLLVAGIRDSEKITEHDPARPSEEYVNLPCVAPLFAALVEAYRLAQSPQLLTRIRRRLARSGVEGRPTDNRLLPLVEHLERAGFTVEWVGSLYVSGETNVFRTEIEVQIPLTPRGLNDFVAEELNPVLLAASPRLTSAGERFLMRSVSSRVQGFLPQLAVQAAEAFAQGRHVRTCCWERCAGAPERPHLFLFRTRLTGGTADDGVWTWKDRPRDRRPRGEEYCSPECANAASSSAARRRGPDAHPGLRRAITRGKGE